LGEPAATARNCSRRAEPGRPDRLVKVVENDERTARELADTRFGNLPKGVTFTPTSLKLEFQGSQDFLQLLGAVLKALENDTHEMILFMDSTL
jgi:hypothetical protein